MKAVENSTAFSVYFCSTIHCVLTEINNQTMEVVTEPVSNKNTFKERITFGNQKSPFFTEIKKEVKQHFENEGIESTGNFDLYSKAVFFTLTYVLGYLSVVFTNQPIWLSLAICTYLGLAAAGLGFNVMHDGSHGSFSNKRWINNLAAHFINILGGDAMLWRNKHNIIHHTFTNIEGYDQDIAQMPVLRLNAMQEKKWFHKYQHIYCYMVYGLSSILWMFLLDYIKYFSRKVGNIRIPKITWGEHLSFWVTKICYVTLYVIIPSFYWELKYVLLGFFVYHFVLGLTISTVFQLAHVVESTEFPNSHFDNQKISDEWAVHQLKTTANFATKSKLVTWFVGGLNYQVEHHLFPKISHVHYPAINHIVKKVANKFGVPYNEYPTFLSALASHTRHMKETAIA